MTTAQVSVVWLNPNPDELTGDVYFANASDLTLKVRVLGVSQPEQANFAVEVDGSKLTASRYGNASLNKSTFSTSVELNPGKQDIRVGYNAGNGYNWSPPLQVSYAAGRANLHVVAIGTSPPNLQFTDKDAEKIADIFRSQDGSDGLYGSVNIKQLVGNEATAANMKRELERLGSAYQLGHIKSNDVLVVYVATHGDVRGEQFYLQGDDFDPLAPESTSLSYQEIVRVFNRLPCKKLLFLDACKSGAARDGYAINNAIQALSRSISGVTIYTSSQAGQLSYEHESWGHGAFTAALLDALRGKADENDDDIISVGELSRFVQANVPRMVLSELGHEQKPELTRNDLGDLPFFKVLNGWIPPPPPVPDDDDDLPGFVFVQGGAFQMGSSNIDAKENETPHNVTVSDFYLAVNELTFEEFDEYCSAAGATKPSDEGWGRGKRPVININWYDAVEYCNWRSEQDGLQKVYTISGNSVTASWSANGYRLPTEAEWEFAARSRGKDEKWAGTNSGSSLSTYANASGSSDGYKYTAPVGSFRSNALGLNDMSGNVFECCWDRYGEYPSSSQANPHGPEAGSSRVLRGGSWASQRVYLRCAYRGDTSPGVRGDSMGFRLARSAR